VLAEVGWQAESTAADVDWFALAAVR